MECPGSGHGLFSRGLLSLRCSLVSNLRSFFDDPQHRAPRTCPDAWAIGASSYVGAKVWKQPPLTSPVKREAQKLESSTILSLYQHPTSTEQRQILGSIERLSKARESRCTRLTEGRTSGGKRREQSSGLSTFLLAISLTSFHRNLL
jgi:hypothetical protein